MSFVIPALGSLGICLIFLGLTHPTPRVSRVRNFLEKVATDAGYPKLSPSRLAAISCACGAVAGIAATTLISSAVVLTVASSAGIWAPLSWLRSHARKRRSSHRDAWPEAIALITSGVRAGVALPDVVSSLADRGPEVLRPHFYSFRTRYRSTNSFRTALDVLMLELSDPIADRIVAALKLTHEVGGSDLVRVLRTLGDFVRDDIRIRKEIEARWSWTVNAARLAAAAPWIVLVTMASRPEAAAAFESTEGVAVVLGGALATFAGYRLMLRAGRLPEEERLLR